MVTSGNKEQAVLLLNLLICTSGSFDKTKFGGNTPPKMKVKRKAIQALTITNDYFLSLHSIDMMEDKTRAEYNLPPFDVVVRSSWLAKRKCHCPAHIAQSSSPPAAISEDHVVAVVDKLDDASENQQQDLNKPLWNGNTKKCRVFSFPDMKKGNPLIFLTSKENHND